MWLHLTSASRVSTGGRAGPRAWCRARNRGQASLGVRHFRLSFRDPVQDPTSHSLVMSSVSFSLGQFLILFSSFMTLMFLNNVGCLVACSCVWMCFLGIRQRLRVIGKTTPEATCPSQDIVSGTLNGSGTCCWCWWSFVMSRVVSAGFVHCIVTLCLFAIENILGEILPDHANVLFLRLLPTNFGIHLWISTVAIISVLS